MRVSSQQRSNHYKSQHNHTLGYHTRTQPDVSAHSEHLWNMMEDIEIYPEQVHQLLKHQKRNLTNFKKQIEREKAKANIEVENMKKEYLHNIDDLKLSILAALDRIYVAYMEKYATLKSQIMQIKKMKDDIEIDLERRSNVFIPKYTSKDRNELGNKTHNANIMRTIESNTIEAKKSEMLKYISELQKDKLLPLNELTRELVVLTQYENGFYQNNDFQNITTRLIADLKITLQGLSQRKYEFIRDPDQLCMKEDQPILDEIYEEEQQPISLPYSKPIVSHLYPNPAQKRIQTQPVVSKLQTVHFNNIAQNQQSISFNWAEDVALTPTQTIRSVTDDILLCAIQISRNLIAVGSKDGLITIYDTNTTQKITNLKGHKAGICKMAIITHSGKTYLASGSDRGCSTIVLWDINTWNIRMRLSGHTGAVTAIVDLQDNRSLISGSYDKTINIYNLNNEGKVLYNLPVNKTQVTNILLNSNGSKIVSCGLDNSLSVWKVVRNTGHIVQTIFLERIIENNTLISAIVASVVTPQLVYLGAKDGKIKLINIDQGDAYKIYNVCNTAVVEIVAVERQNKSEYPILVFWASNEESARVINTESGRVTVVPTKGAVVYGCEIGPKAFFSCGGRTLAMVSQTTQRREVNLLKLDIIS